GFKVRPNHPGNPHGPRIWDELSVNKIIGWNKASRSVIEGNQVVGLAAAKGSLQPDDRVIGRFCAGQASQGFVKKKPEAFRRVGIVEEYVRPLVQIVRIAFDDIPQACGE